MPSSRTPREAERFHRPRGRLRARRARRRPVLRRSGPRLLFLVLAHVLVVGGVVSLRDLPAPPVPTRQEQSRSVSGRVDDRPVVGPPAPSVAPAPPVVPVPESASGRFTVAGGVPARTRTAGLHRYRVEVEQGLPYDAPGFARSVDAILGDARSWEAEGFRLRRVTGPAEFRIVLASPQTVDRLCAPAKTEGRVSCRNGFDVVINAWRWQRGARTYTKAGADLAAYRRYVVNHETGHALGRGHVGCPRRGGAAPVMLQQTVSLDGCRPNPWPAGDPR